MSSFNVLGLVIIAAIFVGLIVLAYRMAAGRQPPHRSSGPGTAPLSTTDNAAPSSGRGGSHHAGGSSDDGPSDSSDSSGSSDD
jgi:hypothetical protein